MKTCFKMTGRSKAGVSVSMHDFVPTPEEHCPPVIEILSVSRSTLLKNFGNKMATRNQKPRRSLGSNRYCIQFDSDLQGFVSRFALYNASENQNTPKPSGRIENHTCSDHSWQCSPIGAQRSQPEMDRPKIKPP